MITWMNVAFEILSHLCFFLCGVSFVLLMARNSLVLSTAPSPSKPVLNYASETEKLNTLLTNCATLPLTVVWV
jgi:hypothetical protein